ncbi:MAG: Ig-like domain-containing protein [Dysgonamonadaceae bacterium]|nr:Ig-like domain-containing protein [Dysgonamonadaceae bacterium]
MKKVYLLLLCLACFTINMLAYDFVEGGIAYEINADATTVSVVQGDSPYTGTVVVPSTVTHDAVTYTVTEIGFLGMGDGTMTSLTLPPTITSIGAYAFRNQQFTQLVLPDALTTIGAVCFQGCNKLTSIVIPDNVTEIPDACFMNCTALKTITIGASVTSCTGGNGVFNGCNLSTIILKPTTPPTIGAWPDFTSYNFILVVPCEARDAYLNTNGSTNAWAYCAGSTAASVFNSGDVAAWEAYAATHILGTTAPTVVTDEATNVQDYYATLNKTVTSSTDCVPSSGFEYHVQGAATWTTVTDGALSGLTENTTYEFRAYVIGDDGNKIYDVTKTFTTLAPQPRTVKFDAGTGTASDTELTGASITLPNATACSPASDGETWTFKGWATAPVTTTTTSSAAWLAAGTTYVPKSEGIVFYAVYQKTVSASTTLTSSITRSQVTQIGNSAAQRNWTITTSGITVAGIASSISQGGSGNNRYMVLAANSIFYNTAAITGGLKSIAITYYGTPTATVSATVYTGTTQQPTATMAGVLDKDNTTLDITGSPTYFLIECNGEVTNASSITLTYDATLTTTTYDSNPLCDNTTTYTATFETNGGSPVPADQTVYGTKKVTKPATNPTKAKSTFVNWYADADCTTLYDFTAVPNYTGNFTIYALWLNNYDVTFETYGGTSIGGQVVNEGLTAAKPANPTKEYSIFDGWYTDADCTAAYDFSTPVTADITLYAKWINACLKYTYSLDDTEGYGWSDVTVHIIQDGKVVAILPQIYPYDDNTWGFQYYEDGEVYLLPDAETSLEIVTGMYGDGYITSASMSLTDADGNAVYQSAAGDWQYDGAYPSPLTSFTTDHCAGSPTVVTGEVTVNKTTATLTSTVTAGSDPIIEQGYEYREEGAAVWLISADGNLTGLTANVTYEFRAYAKTDYETIYGETVTFAIYDAYVAVTNVSINPTVATLYVGQTQALTATVTPSDAANKNVTWSSSDASVATVDANGVVTAVGPGTATITVTTEEGGYTAACTVTVKAYVTGVTLDKTSISIMNHSTAQLTATVIPDNADNKSVTWSTSNASIATVSSTGLVTAVGEGEATITVTTVSGLYTATCAVTVTPDTGLDAISSEVKVYVQDGNLYVESPVAEKISVYSASGTMLYTAVKPAGKALITLDAARNGIFVVKGTGWVKKAVK